MENSALIHSVSVFEALKAFNSSEGGIDALTADKHRKSYGANVLSKKKRAGIFTRIFKSVTEPMMLILLAALGITLAVSFINFFQGLGFDFIEPLGILGAISLSSAISLIMDGRSQKAFSALNKYAAGVKVKVLRSGEIILVAAAQIVVGDIIRLGVGDRVPADCRLIKSHNLFCDESALTGESQHVKKEFNHICDKNNAPLAERKNMIYGGTFVTAGTCDALVTAVGDASEIGKIAAALTGENAVMTPLQQKLDKLGKVVALLGGLAATVVFAVRLIALIVAHQASLNSVREIFVTSIVLIVASVPEGLPTVVAVCLALNVIKMAKQNALVKKMPACETVGSVSVICSDKTGTLTQNKMTVLSVVTLKTAYAPDKIQNDFILSNFALNSNSEIKKTKDKSGENFSFIGNPTECAMLVAYEKSRKITPYNALRSQNTAVCVFPFSSETKRMTSVIKGQNSLTTYVKGAPELVLKMCNLSAAERADLERSEAVYQKKAARLIALAHGQTPMLSDYENNRGRIEKNLIFDGFAVISDPVRADVKQAVDECKKAGIEVKMLTGDNILTAAAVAEELGIISSSSGGGLYSADKIDAMTDEELAENLKRIKVVARSTPSTKLRIVKALQECGEVTAVTGDGINDAPAIKRADVGIAMGQTGTEVTNEAADITLLDDSFSTIVKSVKWGRGIYENFRRFILFQFTVNISAVLLTVICVVAGMDAPFSAMQLLWINLIMDGPPALSLGLEPVYSALMKRKPVKRGENIVSKTMCARIFINGIFITLVLILQAAFDFLGLKNGQKEKTALFTMFVLFQLFNAFNARELGGTSVIKTAFRNKIMLLTMILTLLLQILITQKGGRMFGTVPLSLTEWLKITAAALSVIVFSEAYKAAYKLHKRIRARNATVGARRPRSPA